MSSEKSPMLLKKSYKYHFTNREHDESIYGENITKRVCQTNFMRRKRYFMHRNVREWGGPEAAKFCCLPPCVPPAPPPVNEERYKTEGLSLAFFLC